MFTRSRNDFYEKPEPKVELSSQVVMHEVLEMGLADTDPVFLSKNQDLAARRGPHKADLASFDREKFYSRLGINPDDTQKLEADVPEE